MAKSAAATKVPAVNFFAKAKQAAPPADAKKRKQTSWLINGQSDDEMESLEQDIHDILAQSAIMETAKNGKSLASKRVCDFALTQYAADYANVGVPPESPMIVSNKTGENVTFVVQDKTGTAVVTAEQEAALVELLGEDGANEVLVSKEAYAFSNEVLAQEGVMDALSHAIAKLVEGKLLTEEQAGGLIVASTKRHVKPGTLGRLADVCGRNNVKIEQFMRTVHGPVVTYIKA